MDLIFNEDTKQFELAKQPYKTVEIRCETEEDYNDFEKILNLSQPRKPIESDEQVIRYVQTYECPICGGDIYRKRSVELLLLLRTII